MVPLRVRGKVLLFQNHSHVVRLALRQNLEKQALAWFLGELRKDIDAVEGPVAPERAPKKKRKLEVSTDIQDIASEILRDLHELQGCKAASYLASRKALLVTRKDKRQKQFCIESLQRSHKHALDLGDPDIIRRNFFQELKLSFFE